MPANLPAQGTSPSTQDTQSKGILFWTWLGQAFFWSLMPEHYSNRYFSYVTTFDYWGISLGCISQTAGAPAHTLLAELKQNPVLLTFILSSPKQCGHTRVGGSHQCCQL